MELIKPEIGLIVWQTVVFVILVFLLAKFAWRPILGLIKERESSINDALDSAEKARLEMKNLQASNEKLIKKAREERDEMLKEARTIKEKMISEASTEAEEKASKILANAQETIIAEKQAALAEIKAQVASLSIEIAEKVVKKELDSKEDQMKLVDSMLDDVKLN
ncbi:MULTISPECIES: F0F1 ATP synthase subunit B [Mesonia]|uniref:ATP synthase subunit b n=1 Tax=Mesonia mobilis TaxID=369791 RepID=A0ABQ3C0K2_9FLAO|nr:F0F1 ATP synthase subunit B [Mesonia mobilis]GGZ60537.1 ATP synthase subunit b [Mesonia mobilis]|tara:strand:- start:470 stop:964 length:495 start_codon:yes stop_codon:yes gene_type:complete